MNYEASRSTTAYGQGGTQHYPEAVPAYVVESQAQDAHGGQQYSVAVQPYQVGHAQGGIHGHLPICRGCGRQFQRKQGVNPATAQYHRCHDCNVATTRDMLLVNATCGASNMCAIQ